MSAVQQSPMLEDAYGRYPNSQREGTGSMTGPTVIYRGDTSMLGRRPGLGEILSTVRASSVFTHRPSVSTVFARDTLRSGPRPTVPRPSDPSLRSGSENFTFLGVDSVREGRVRPVGRHVPLGRRLGLGAISERRRYGHRGRARRAKTIGRTADNISPSPGRLPNLDVSPRYSEGSRTAHAFLPVFALT